jgi:hypothetical protein
MRQLQARYDEPQRKIGPANRLFQVILVSAGSGKAIYKGEHWKSQIVLH